MGDPGLDDRLGTISKSVAAIGDAGARAAERMAASFDTATLTMSASLKRMAEQMASVSVPGVASGPNTFLGGPRGSGTPLPGWHGRGDRRDPALEHGRRAKSRARRRLLRLA